MTTALQHIQKAAAHVDAAGRADEKHVQQMKAAGAETFAAFVLVMKDAGKPVPTEPAAFDKFYAYARKDAWDAALRQMNKDREWGKRILQWHIDPAAALARRAERSLADHKRRVLESKRKNQGPRSPRSAEPSVSTAAARVSETHVPRATREDERREAETIVPPGPVTSSVARMHTDNPLPAARGVLKNISDRIGSAPAYAVEAAVDTLRSVLADLQESIRQEKTA